jgi:arginine decarboxylase-like protein
VHDDEEQNNEKYKSIFSNFLKEYRDFCNKDEYWENLPDLIPPSQDAIDSITTALQYGKLNLPKDWTEEQVKEEMEKKEAELRGTEKKEIREQLTQLIPNLNQIFLAGIETKGKLLS